MDILMEKTSLAATVEFRIGSDERSSYRVVPVSLFLIGTPDPTDADDKIEVQFPDESNPASVVWVTAKVGGEDVVLDKDTNIQTIYGPGKFRLNRPAGGTAAIGVALM